ncbi:hypothetical protein [Streptomyces sp. NPDC055299]
MGQPGRFTADEPAYREAIGRLVYDAPLSAVRCPLSAVPEADSATFLDNARTPAPNRCRGGCRTG